MSNRNAISKTLAISNIPIYNTLLAKRSKLYEYTIKQRQSYLVIHQQRLQIKFIILQDQMAGINFTKLIHSMDSRISRLLQFIISNANFRIPIFHLNSILIRPAFDQSRLQTKCKNNWRHEYFISNNIICIVYSILYV